MGYTYLAQPDLALNELHVQFTPLTPDGADPSAVAEAATQTFVPNEYEKIYNDLIMNPDREKYHATLDWLKGRMSTLEINSVSHAQNYDEMPELISSEPEQQQQQKGGGTSEEVTYSSQCLMSEQPKPENASFLMIEDSMMQLHKQESVRASSPDWNAELDKVLEKNRRNLKVRDEQKKLAGLWDSDDFTESSNEEFFPNQSNEPTANDDHQEILDGRNKQVLEDDSWFTELEDEDVIEEEAKMNWKDVEERYKEMEHSLSWDEDEDDPIWAELEQCRVEQQDCEECDEESQAQYKEKERKLNEKERQEWEVEREMWEERRQKWEEDRLQWEEKRLAWENKFRKHLEDLEFREEKVNKEVENTKTAWNYAQAWINQELQKEKKQALEAADRLENLQLTIDLIHF